MNGQAENKICPACAAEIRDGAVFCFNCGKSFEADPNPESAPSKPKVRARKVKSEEADVDEVPAETARTESEATGEAVEEKQEKVRVRPAADGVKRPQRFSRREVEVEWAAPTEGPGASFVLGAAVLGAFSVLIFLIALYLK